MGVNCSCIDHLKSNNDLSRFAGEEDLLTEDDFWTSFLSFRLQLSFTKDQSKLLEETCSIYLQQLEANNPRTNNYGTLIEIFIRLATVVREQNNNELLMLQTTNALFILRVITKYFIEINSEQNLCHYFIPADNSFQRISLMCLLIDTLYRSSIIVPVRENSYSFHLEIFNTLLAFLSIRMCADEAALISAIFSIFMNRLDALLVSEFTRTLIEHFIRQNDCPTILADQSEESITKEKGSLVKLGQTVASGFWTVFTLGLMSPEIDTKSSNRFESLIDFRRRHLSNQSLHLLLILSNHFTNDMYRNPYRSALLQFIDTKDNPNKVVDLDATPCFSVDFRCLFNVFCQTIQSDQSTLLLYFLLYRNESFKSYLISRSDIDQLILPMLQVIHQSEDGNSHHVYMLLIIILILSEDEQFNQKIHYIKVNKLHWYNERLAHSLTLGDLLIVIVLRAIHLTLSRSNDKYLHSNCLAALANMSSNYENLHIFVCQRILSLLNLLSRKYWKLLDQIEQQTMPPESIQDPTLFEDVLRMMLEIIDSCLTHKLQRNVNLIYAMIYDRELFDQYRDHLVFRDTAQNICNVIDFFSEKIDQFEQRSADFVRTIIEKNLISFPSNQLKKMGELKFKYIEEEQPEDFFVPYVWNLIHKSSHLYWSSEPTLISKQNPIN